MLTNPQPSLFRISDVAQFGGYVFKQAGLRAYCALGSLFLGSLTEGISILLLIPVLQLIGPSGNDLVVRLPTSFLSGLLGPEVRIGLLQVLGLLVLLVLAQAMFMRFKNIYLAGLLYGIVNGLRIRLFESIGRARWPFIARVRGSDLNHLLTADIDRVQSAAFHLLMLIQNCVLLAIYVCVSWLISPSMTLFASVIGAGALFALFPLRKYALAYGNTLTENRQAQYRTVSEFLSGIKIAKSFNAEPRYIAELESTLEKTRRDYDRFVRINSVSGVLFQISTAVGLAVFVYVALARFALPLAQIVVLIFLFMRVSPRIMSLQGHLQEVLVNLPAFDAIQRMRADCEREQEQDVLENSPVPSLMRELRFEGVSLSYSGGEAGGEVLSRVSFAVPALLISALIGPSGSGKSTVADALMGLLETEAGAITIDGVELNAGNRRAWREHVAYVPQDVFLLHDTIAANLRLAAADASDEAMWEALRAANAHYFVESLPDRLLTMVGDRGVRLSGGERQRIALARAMLRRPQLLILDEATSALDWGNQTSIARAIEQLRGSMTILTIAHRPSMIALADWVVALEDGRIVESGTYDELMRRKESRLSQLLVGEQIRGG